jgi:hypothetical protein
VRKNEGKTCAFCHGGRVYPEFTGQYGVVKDIHHERGMTCLDCHCQTQLHGDGQAYRSRREVRAKPSCAQCHPPDKIENPKAAKAHRLHSDSLTCQACHAVSTYKNCRNCHLGKGSQTKAGFFLGRSPRNPGIVTTLRLVPTVRTTFEKAGIRMSRYDRLPNYWDSTPHVIRKQTERTSNCQMCHLVKMGFLTSSKLIQGGANANEKLVYTPKPIP